jgi:hypothetical protein
MRLFHFRTLLFKVSLRAEKLQAVALSTGPLERARREMRVVVANMVNLQCVVMSIKMKEVKQKQWEAKGECLRR